MPASMACQDEPSSLECIHKSELFPKKELISEDKTLQVPFPLLCGESAEFLGRTTDGIIALSNFRLLIRFKDSFVNVPLGLIESVESRDIFHIAIYCKDATVVRCSFTTNELCQDWFKRLMSVIASPSRLEDLFAFAFHAWCLDNACSPEQEACQLCHQEDTFKYSFGKEVNRMRFDLRTSWRISYINEDYKTCPSYPEQHIVPACITDDELKSVAGFRAIKRFPSVVWRCQRNGAVLVRCSQPELGWLGWRNAQDENLLHAIPLACAKNLGTENRCQSQDVDLVENEDKIDMSMGIRDKSSTVQRMLIIDARSYSAAFANRAKGGGCECAEYYPNCEIQFMNLANIHSIRKSFAALRSLCGASPDQPNWLSGLENTKWLHYIAGLLKAACIVASAIDKEGRPVLVHCSDGWDRTPQIVALVELLLDPFYRTIMGFRILVEREWLEFGHKFADRCGHGVKADDGNERCPVFLQWLDCVYQVHRQFPCAFEFNEAYLVKLVQHTYSCLFGTFLCNTSQERSRAELLTKTASVWLLLKPENKKFHNHLYSSEGELVLYPSCHVRNLSLWTSVYLSNNASTTSPEDSFIQGAEDYTPEETKQEIGNLPKTRSCDDIVAALEHSANPNRRLSDPSMTLENHDQGTFFSKESGSKDAIASIGVYDSSNQQPVVPIELCNGNHSSEEENQDSQMNMAPLQNGIIKSVFNDIIHSHSPERNNYLVVSVRPKSEVRTSNKSSQASGNESFESSTDTIVGDEVHSRNEICSESCENSNKLLNHNEESSCDEEEDDDSNNRTLEKCSSISTSTSDISDSHVIGESNENSLPLCRELKLKCLLSQQSLKMNCSRENCSQITVLKTESCPTTPIYPTPVCSKTSNSMPLTPAVDTKASESTFQRHLSGVGRHLDLDGLTTFNDSVQQRVHQIESDYRYKIETLQRNLNSIYGTLYQCTSGYNGTGRYPVDAKDDIMSLPESTGSGELHSLGNCSNAASDVSWEHVDERESKMTLWVPDHAVTHCAGCEKQFWIARRRHHCRNCGKVFCSECTSYYMPIPNQQLMEPARVCQQCFPELQESNHINPMEFVPMDDQPFAAAAAASN